MTENGGGAFLSTLKQKNERQRGASVASSSMRKASIFGSLFSGSSSGSMRKDSVVQTTTVTETRTESRSQASTSQPSEVLHKAPFFVSQDEVRVGTVEMPEEKDNAGETKVDTAGPIISEQKVEETMHIPRPEVIVRSSDSVARAPIREIASTGRLENEVSPHLAGAHAPQRQRRVSTTVERRASTAMVEHPIDGTATVGRERGSSIASSSNDIYGRAGHSVEGAASTGRERGASIANINDVYGRAAREPREFLVLNPLLVEPPRQRGLSVTHSSAEIENAHNKRESLYRAAIHIDHTQLLERRNTRAGRSQSVDAPEASSRDGGSTMEPAEAVAEAEE